MAEYKTIDEWRNAAVSLFGQDPAKWRFKCPRCGNVAAVAEFDEFGVKPDVAAYECIGRYRKDKGCDWAAYGLFDICTTHVEGIPVFDFAPEVSDASQEG